MSFHGVRQSLRCWIVMAFFIFYISTTPTEPIRWTGVHFMGYIRRPPCVASRCTDTQTVLPHQQPIVRWNTVGVPEQPVQGIDKVPPW